MDEDDPGGGRPVLGAVVGLVVVSAAAMALATGVLAQPDGVSGGADATTGAVAMVLGWGGLALGPVVGLGVGGVPWRRALWAAPALPALVLLFGALG